jgi:hypothetical protein
MDYGLNIPEVEPSFKGKDSLYENYSQRYYANACVFVCLPAARQHADSKTPAELQIRLLGGVRLERQLW